MMALEPEKYGLIPPYPGQRCLELGAGTGLLSLVWKGMSERVAVDAGLPGGMAEVVATDYHEGESHLAGQAQKDCRLTLYTRRCA